MKSPRPDEPVITVRLNDGKWITVPLATGNRLVRKGRAMRIETGAVKPGENAMIQRGEPR